MPINRDTLLRVADSVRSKITPPIRTIAVTIRTQTYPGAIVGSGTPVNVDVALPSYVKVRQLTAKEVAGSGGKYEMGDVKIGPITPPYTSGGGGGVADSVIEPDGAPNVRIIYMLSGAETGNFTRITATTDRPFRYEVVVRRTRTSP